VLPERASLTSSDVIAAINEQDDAVSPLLLRDREQRAS